MQYFSNSGFKKVFTVLLWGIRNHKKNQLKPSACPIGSLSDTYSGNSDAHSRPEGCQAKEIEKSWLFGEEIEHMAAPIPEIQTLILDPKPTRVS